MKNGFTLMEVCVALAVLSAGIVVFGRYLDGFNRLRSLEREQARAVIETAQAVEYFVQNAPACRDTVFAFGAPATAILVSLETVPGAKPLAWLHASKPAPQKVVFRRLIHCKRNEPALR
ncbi:type II secretion system protein J [Fibrobacter sp.]|uniref:PulJ/GspJ family protein n=1 Tax=Fibrobacter sp. TaxID=35828 RepID=UPI003869C154